LNENRLRKTRRRRNALQDELAKNAELPTKQHDVRMPHLPNKRTNIAQEEGLG
jgi:hypothetical protein